MEPRRGHDRSHRLRPGRQRLVRALAVVLTGLLTAGVACTPDSGGTPVDPGPGDTSLPAPTVRQGDGSVRLGWTVDAPAGATYEWQWREYGTTVWSGATTAQPQVDATAGLRGGRLHWARVRYVADGTPGEWSSGKKFLYVDLTLPVVRIDTAGEAPVVDKDVYLDATIGIDPNGAAYPAYSGTTRIKGRGNSTWSAPKKPYRLKLSAKASLLGMPANRDWVLLADFFDPSHLRNEVAFQLSGRTGLAWTPRFRYVEVILNGSYDGLYLLGEHIEVDPDRVNIDEMSDTDVAGDSLTGGYLLEFDFHLNTNIEPGFISNEGVEIVIKDPDPPTPEQFDYIRNHINSFEAVVRSDTFTDPATGYRAWLDVDAFLDWYFLAELAKQQDSMWSSSYVTKPRNGKLTFGPVWDFDLSMGARNEFTPGWPADGWWINLPFFGRWLPRLFEDPALKAQARERWNQLLPEFRSVVAGSTRPMRGSPRPDPPTRSVGGSHPRTSTPRRSSPSGSATVSPGSTQTSDPTGPA
ncbi:MAG: CotH kinase family protein [Microthrixaceae bacterium]